MKSRVYGLGQRLKIAAAYSEFVGLPSPPSAETVTVRGKVGEIITLTDMFPSKKLPRLFNLNWVAWDQQNRRQAVNNTAG